MRQFFEDGKVVKQIAENNVKKGNASLRKWWSDKYKLPAYHELFLSRTETDLMIEFYEDLYLEKESIESEMEKEGETRELLNRLNAVGIALGDEDIEKDELIEKWEKELSEGKIPDLNEGLK